MLPLFSRRIPPAALLQLTGLGEGRPAVVSDPRATVAVRSLGFAIQSTTEEAGPLDQAVLLCADLSKVPDAIALLQQHAARLPPGSQVVARAPVRTREDLAAAFLFAGLCDIQQLPIGRYALTAGLVRADRSLDR